MDDEAVLAETTKKLTVAVQVVFCRSAGHDNVIQVGEQWDVSAGRKALKRLCRLATMVKLWGQGTLGKQVLVQLLLDLLPYLPLQPLHKQPCP